MTDPAAEIARLQALVRELERQLQGAKEREAVRERERGPAVDAWRWDRRG